jgi:hypothetical protein
MECFVGETDPEWAGKFNLTQMVGKASLGLGPSGNIYINAVHMYSTYVYKQYMYTHTHTHTHTYKHRPESEGFERHQASINYLYTSIIFIVCVCVNI